MDDIQFKPALTKLGESLRILLKKRFKKKFSKKDSKPGESISGHPWISLGGITTDDGQRCDVGLGADKTFFGDDEPRARIYVWGKDQDDLYDAIPWLKDSKYPRFRSGHDIDRKNPLLSEEVLARFGLYDPYLEDRMVDDDGIYFTTYVFGDPTLPSGHDKIPSQAASFVIRAFEAESREEFERLEEMEDVAEIKANQANETTRKQLIDARLGQGNYRKKLLEKWDNKCSVTGCPYQEILRASHILPWHAATDKQRLDPNNGLLLVATLDALFDRGLITFDDKGKMLSSEKLRKNSHLDWINTDASLKRITPEIEDYLRSHRSLFELKATSSIPTKET